MKLKSFKVKNCFGFGDSDEVIFDSEKNLYYVLGRNSSGKTSFLEALNSFECKRTPFENHRFTNFNKKGKIGSLIMKFEIKKQDITSDTLISEIKKRILKNNNMLIELEKFKNFFEIIREEYFELIKEIEKKGEVIILKDGKGNYRFYPEENEDKIYEDRKNRISKIISDTYNSIEGDNRFVMVESRKYPLDFEFKDIENLLFLQFPPIHFFNNEYPLDQDLPDRLSENDINNDEEESFFRTFLEFLSKEELKRFFESENPDEEDVLRNKFQKKIDTLTEKINSKNPDHELLRIRFSGKDGLQITFQTEGKQSYYRHLSDNTKFLFAYYLYAEKYKINKGILLFDEPNKGFHPSAQQDLLKFLKHLSLSNTAIIATHSEYIIDIDFLKGVKVMSQDKDGRLLVRNSLHIKEWGKSENLALTPLFEAIGLKARYNLNIKDKVIITEGITDLYYIRAFRKILDNKSEIALVPLSGEPKFLTVIPFIISQGLFFKIVIDWSTNKKVKKEIVKNWDIDEKYIYTIPLPQGFTGVKNAGIEDLFSKNDFYTIVLKRKIGERTKRDFEKVPNSAFIKNVKGEKNTFKRVIAFDFYDGSRNFESSDFEEETISNFKNLLDFCVNDDWFKI